MKKFLILIFTLLTSLWVFAQEESIDETTDSVQEAVEQAAQPTENQSAKNKSESKKKSKSKIVDSNLEPKFASSKPSPLFENIIAVQKRAKSREGRWIAYPYFSADFSDAPYTMWGMNLNLGRALSEHWELYFNVVPFYITSERSISKKVKELTLANGKKARIDFDKAKIHAGFEVNFVPAYGKDSWGPFGIIRSDTFLNTGLGVVQYETGTGLRTKLGLGKTFYVSESLNVRGMAGGSFVEMISGGSKEIVMVGLLEAGFVFYF